MLSTSTVIHQNSLIFLHSKVNIIMNCEQISNKGFSSPNHSTRVIVIPKKSFKHYLLGKLFYGTYKIGGCVPIWNGHNFALERHTKLHNHLKMIRRVILCGADQGSKSLKPLVFELWTTSFLKPTILA